MFIDELQPQYTRPLVEHWRKSFEHGVGITDPHPLEDQLAYFETTVLPANAVRIALLGSELVGFLASTPQSVECLSERAVLAAGSARVIDALLCLLLIVGLFVVSHALGA